MVFHPTCRMIKRPTNLTPKAPARLTPVRLSQNHQGAEKGLETNKTQSSVWQLGPTSKQWERTQVLWLRGTVLCPGGTMGATLCP